MTAPTEAKLIAIAPQFLVPDLQAALDFYLERLGFRIAFRYSDFYAAVERDGMMIHLKHSDEPDPGRRTKQHGDHLDAYISVTGVVALYEEYQRRGVAFAQPLQATAWGTQEFVVWDNSGYILYFGQPS
ncbi:MAG: VOC family protein [Armatimonadetes bacterium]|nr:VOC family protein [Armatimonadota bacterium]MDE2205193.1 VOC family protein [Armatimonadota bacterium]